MPERIADRQSLNRLSMLHVFEVERSAAGFDRDGQNHSIINMKAIFPGNLQCRIMRLCCQGNGFSTQDTNLRHCFYKLIPRHFELAPRDCGKLIQYLNTDDTALGENFFGYCRSRIVLCGNIDQNCRVEKYFIAHGSLHDRA